MITTTDKVAAETLRSEDAKAQGFPMPGAWGDPLCNRCGACSEPVEGPETRYRCKTCGLTADEYECPMQYSADVEEDKGTYKYPETETAAALILSAKAKPDNEKTPEDSLLAKCEAESKPADPKELDGTTPTAIDIK